MQNEDALSFVVSREDWSLHRKGYQDQVRHQHKIREVIKRNLPDLITEENIILSDGKQIIKVPIRSLDEYRFIYNYQKQKHVGQGDGDSQVGDVLGRDPSAAQPGKENRPVTRRDRILWKPRSAWKSWRICCLRSWSSRCCSPRTRSRSRRSPSCSTTSAKRHHVQHR